MMMMLLPLLLFLREELILDDANLLAAILASITTIFCLYRLCLSRHLPSYLRSLARSRAGGNFGSDE
jgi:hypothetical protein